MGSDISVRRHSTVELPVIEQYPYWREALCRAYTPLVPMDRDSSRDRWRHHGITGVVEERALGAVNATRIHSIAQRIDHGHRELAQTQDEVVCVNLTLGGRCIGRQGERVSDGGPGTIVLFDASREFYLDYVQDWTVISFRVPREQLFTLVPALDRMTSIALPAQQGMPAVVADLMRSLWREAEHLDADAATTLGSGFVSTLAAALRGARTHDGDPLGAPLSDAALRAAIINHVGTHIGAYSGTALTPPAIAQHFDVSVRKLHALFEDSELTYGQTVMRLRVQACAAELRSPTSTQTLTALAARFGFSDLSHLNRVFRTHLGCSPSQYRTVGRPT